MDIKQALATLDPNNEDLWTGDGLPMVNAVIEAVGQTVTRVEITNADPNFTRDMAFLVWSGDDSAPAETVAGAEVPAAAPVEAPEAAPVETLAMTDAETAAYVPIEDDVVAMSVQDVYHDAKLIDRAIEEFNRQAAILSARRDAVSKQLIDVGRRSAQLTAAFNKLPRGKPKVSATQVYLKQQAKNREARAARAKAFIDQGTTAEDVQKQLQGASPLDAAMKGRRSAPGTTRPAARALNQ